MEPADPVLQPEGGSTQTAQWLAFLGGRSLQAKVMVGATSDPLEREADIAADRVMRMEQPRLSARSIPALLSRKCTACEDDKQLLQREAVGTDSAPGTAPPVVDSVLNASGQPLDSGTNAFMSSRYQTDFSHVRIHTDTYAGRSAAAVGARAYTVGRDIVFGRDQYAPDTVSGRRLLAHELAHVIQQDGAEADMLQRSEVDDRTCGSLKDIESDLDDFVNKAIDDERKTMTPPLSGPLLALRIMQDLGGRWYVSPIETFIESLPATKRTLPPDDLAGTKYQGAGIANVAYFAQGVRDTHIVGSVARVHGICIGADKLGHFFDQGWDFNEVAKAPGSKAQDVTNAGIKMEVGSFGLGEIPAPGQTVPAPATGVFSNADLAANRAGMRFYQDLEKNPGKLKFRIAKYIGTDWNEQTNPSFYKAGVGSVVWSNLLTGKWAGTFASPAGQTSIKTEVDLLATASGTVSGSIELDAKAAPGASNRLNVKNGIVTQKTTTVSTSGPGPAISSAPVSGVSFEFDWDRGATVGKGKLESLDEQTLTGTLGIGASATGSGTFKLRKA